MVRGPTKTTYPLVSVYHGREGFVSLITLSIRNLSSNEVINELSLILLLHALDILIWYPPGLDQVSHSTSAGSRPW